MKCMKDNRGSALVLVMGAITIIALLGMFSMGAALKNYKNVQSVIEDQKTYYENTVYVDPETPET